MRLDESRLSKLTQALEKAVSDHDLPGAVVTVGVGETVCYDGVFGYAEHRRGVIRPMRRDTLFDLASLTKVVSTLPSVLSLIDDGQIRLKDPVSRFISEWDEGDKQSVTIGDLLTHRSGLAASRSFHRSYRDRAGILRALRSDPLENSPGTTVVYSDLGFMLLAEIVEIVTGATLDAYATERIFATLDMRSALYRPADSAYPNTAATEEMDGRSAKVGIVHDENAEAMGGVSGHAGLFARMDDLIRYIQMWLADTGDVLSPAVRRLAVKCHTDGLDGRRGLGWVCRNDQFDHTGDLWPRTTVGHSGFTGTSLAFDPLSRMWMIVLTNDVHYGRERKHIVRLRPLLHNIVGSSMCY